MSPARKSTSKPRRPAPPATTPSPPGGAKVSRGRKLKTVANVRAALAALYRQVELSDLELGRKAKILGYTAQTLLQAIAGVEGDARLLELQSQVRRLTGASR